MILLRKILIWPIVTNSSWLAAIFLAAYLQFFFTAYSQLSLDFRGGGLAKFSWLAASKVYN